MPAFLYRCPATGYRVQGLADAVPASDVAADGTTASYQTVTCAACGRTHLVDPRSGRVAGVEQSPRP